MPACFRRDCPRTYSLEEVNRSAAQWDPSSAADARLEQAHLAAQAACQRSGKTASYASLENGQHRNNATTGSLGSGGWCLEASQRRAPRDSHVSLDHGQSYFLPTPHVAADSKIVDFLAATLRECVDPPACRAPPTFLSVNDFGAGVGQYGHALLSIDPRHRWRGYDGAGNVAKVTERFVGYLDLTTPLSLPRADWVMSLEVGEHVPNEHEQMLVRNLHAHNCRGVLLSWAYPGKWGVGHVNNHGSGYVIGLR